MSNAKRQRVSSKDDPSQNQSIIDNCLYWKEIVEYCSVKECFNVFSLLSKWHRDFNEKPSNKELIGKLLTRNLGNWLQLSPQLNEYYSKDDTSTTAFLKAIYSDLDSVINDQCLKEIKTIQKYQLQQCQSNQCCQSNKTETCATEMKAKLSLLAMCNEWKSVQIWSEQFRKKCRMAVNGAGLKTVKIDDIECDSDSNEKTKQRLNDAKALVIPQRQYSGVNIDEIFLRLVIDRLCNNGNQSDNDDFNKIVSISLSDDTNNKAVKKQWCDCYQWWRNYHRQIPDNLRSHFSRLLNASHFIQFSIIYTGLRCSPDTEWCIQSIFAEMVHRYKAEKESTVEFYKNSDDWQKMIAALKVETNAYPKSWMKPLKTSVEDKWFDEFDQSSADTPMKSLYFDTLDTVIPKTIVDTQE